MFATLLQGGRLNFNEMELATLLLFQGLAGEEMLARDAIAELPAQIVLKKDNHLEMKKENIKRELENKETGAVKHDYKNFENDDRLDRAMDDDHQDPNYSPSDDLKAQYPCEQCGKCFKNKKRVEAHSKKHSETEDGVRDKTIECPSCSKTFSNKYVLKTHMKSHTSNPGSGDRALCNICSKTFANKYILKTHIGSHSIDTEAEGENLSCPVCQKTFSNKYNLKYHIRTHDEHGKENETTLCNVCSKILKRTVLKKHMRNMHGETKTAECRYCGLHTRMSSINAHENRCKRSDEEKLLRKVKCGQCDKALSSRNKLRRHMKNIHGHMI